MITTTKAQDWRTPRALFAGLHADYAFTIDGMASLGNAMLPRYVTQAHDAFDYHFAGERVFINPPFGMIHRVLQLALSWRALAYVFVLLPANIETAWYHDVAIPYAAKTLFRSRVVYEAPPHLRRAKVSAPSFASIACRFGPGVESSGLGFDEVRCGKTGVRL